MARLAPVAAIQKQPGLQAEPHGWLAGALVRDKQLVEFYVSGRSVHGFGQITARGAIGCRKTGRSSG
ncbi:hypothetical protein IT41_10995 [Paracoccus halophilus]|uniref:Uncharacterized protein n=1 Tax=Paracoccus halophilus TaxID=376733 RepID=A0A099F1S1_9RHOB|nr:hypothetical protein IT41_10995 [Paracoccus halophilus]